MKSITGGGEELKFWTPSAERRFSPKLLVIFNFIEQNKEENKFR